MAGYDAFISYSHSTDDRLAPAIRDGLQKLAKPWNKRRALNIFLDKSSLEVSAGLKDSLHAKLEGTEWLILLLSEDSARSEWVGEEIVNWAATKPANRIALVHTQGELHWGQGDWDWERSTALPKALSGVYLEEPLWLDLRRYRDEPNLDIRGNVAFRDDLATLAAPLHGKSKEELVGEDLVQFQRSRRLRRAAVTGLAVLTVLALCAAYVANRARNEAIKEASIATTRQLAAQALVEATDHPDLGLLLAASAHELDQQLVAAGDIPDSLDGPRSSLLQILERTPQLVSYLTGLADRPTAISSAPGSAHLALGEASGVVSLWDTHTVEHAGAPQRLPVPPGLKRAGEVTAIVLSLDATVLAAGSDRGDVVVWDIDSGSIFEIGGDGAPVTSLAVDAASGRVAVGSNRERVTVYEAGGGNTVVGRFDEFNGLENIGFEGRDRLTAVEYDVVKSCEIGGGCSEVASGLSLPQPGASAYLIGRGVGAVSHFSNGGILTGREDSGFSDGHVQLPAGIVSGMAFSPDGKVLAVVQEATMSFWNPVAEQQRAGAEILGVAPGQDTEIVFLNPEGSLLATLADGTVQLWDRSRVGRLGNRLPVQKLELPNVMGGLVAADFSPDGRQVAWTIDPTGDMRCPGEFARTEFWTPDEQAYYAALQAGLHGLCDAEAGQTVAVWSRDTGEIKTLATALPSEIRFLDDERIVVNQQEIWSVEQNQLVEQQAPEIACRDARETWSVTGDGNLVRCLSGVMETKERRELGGFGAGADMIAVGSALSADTRRLALLDRPAEWQVEVRKADASGDESPQIIDLGGEVETLAAWGREGPKPDLTLSPDGRVLAIEYHAGGFSFWSTASGERFHSMPRDVIWGFVFSPDGRLVALNRVNGEIELRETTTFRRVGVLRGDGDSNGRILKFRNDGKVLMEATVGGGMTLWDLDVDSWHNRACALAGRTFNEEERLRFEPSSRPSKPGLLERITKPGILDWLTKAGRVRLAPCVLAEEEVPWKAM